MKAPPHAFSSSLSRILQALLLGLLALPALVRANPSVGPFLQDPASILPFQIESTDFWKSAWDTRPGERGFFSNVGLTGTPLDSDKAFLSQTRNAYAFSKTFMITGDAMYLEYADGALRFMYGDGWDSVERGWWGQALPNGAINRNIWYNSSRWSFWQSYMLLGILSYVEATEDPYHSSWADTGNRVNDEELWDHRPGLGGYFNRANLDWTNKREKGFTPTVDAITTNALSNYLMTRSPERRERLIALGDNIVDRMMDPAHGHVVSFPSAFDGEWGLRADSPTTSVGHHIKTAWCLARVFLIEPDPKYRAAAEQLMDEVWSHRDAQGNGIWDHTHGIMRGHINVFTGAVSGVADWWSVEQGFTGSIMNWYISRKPEYLEMANRSLEFFMEHYYDYENGEVFRTVQLNGLVTDDRKGDMFKSGYHSVELFFLTYLYGNLYYKNEPVTLHYRFEPTPEARSISLWPIAYEEDRLIISAVTREGEADVRFNADTRTLEIPAGEGGIYAVTFESRYILNPPAHFESGWWFDWFGWVYFAKDIYPWVYVPRLGWSYIFGHGKERANWFYAADGDFFYYALGEYFPWVYRVGVGWMIPGNT